MAVLQRATEKPAGSVFIFNFAVTNLTLASGAHGSPHHLRNGGDFGFLEGIPEKSTGRVDRTPTHNTHLCSTVCSQARNGTHNALGSRIALSSLRPKTSVVIWCGTCVVLSRAFLHELFLFFTYLSYNTPRTLSTCRTSPSSFV